MTAKDYLEFIVNQIHTTIVATVDENGLPVTCVIDMMYADDDGLYFLTAKGKSFYKRLKSKEYLSLSGMKGENTMSSISVSVRGKEKRLEVKCFRYFLNIIHICTRFIPQMKVLRHLRYSRFMRAAENGLTCPKSR